MVAYFSVCMEMMVGRGQGEVDTGVREEVASGTD